MDLTALYRDLGLNPKDLESGALTVETPIDGSVIARIDLDTAATADQKIARAQAAFVAWRSVPPPRRGELIRLFGDALRQNKDALGRLVTIECGKILSEGLGEVQEMIDICDFAVGLSRQLYGLTIASERPGHRMMETWHPLGPTGVISAFNFPVAVWAWNLAIAIVCGNSVVWKPSEKTPVTALACTALFEEVCAQFDEAPEGLHEILIGERNIGETLVDDERVPLISATGSVPMGRAVGPRVAKRFGRSILELGGNNAMIVTPHADLDLALPAIVFSAVGTAGQRCTSLRRLILHESMVDQLLPRLEKAYDSLAIGNPLDSETLVGPVIDADAGSAMQQALAQAATEGGSISGGGAVSVAGCEGGTYVRPAIIRMPQQSDIVRDETFAPILYVLTYKDLDEAINIHNGVPQGLSSAIFTTDIREAEYFLSAQGSDCGIANVNIGTSGAEIGGAFGGEKQTGGGRESGSDAWKAYMRRATNTVNYSSDLPLAQGVKFDI